ncbi:MAG TPA: aminotransferase class I/II-fold pyridoxal phosphate-dependent enzyme [Bryobacteraceae bacterium]|nr:aminotransferase class I/II-fold pyridoxal phosphate-dependent enzyme [Bryobacteraceae bacterium]
MTRRSFAAQFGVAAAAARLLPEMAYAQRAAVNASDLPKDMVWLNANENPAGPPKVALEAMQQVLPTSNRYHYQEFHEIYSAIAKSEDLAPNQIVTGCGSSEVLHTSVDVFTSPTRPLISVSPAYEGPIELARVLGRPVILTKLREDYTADVHRLAEEAEKAHGGLIYLCNPNNPTSAMTTGKEIDWLVANLPANTTLLVDEAYIHFGENPELKTALPYVRQGKDVIVTRTYSKIYGMAGLRVGFAAARPDIIERLTPLRLNVISIVSARAVVAALGDQQNMLRERRATLAHARRETCDWLRDRKVKFIEPHANFMMVDCGRNAKEFIEKMPRLGVAPGRPFPPLDNMLRVTIGTDAEMARFREVFWKVYKA